MPCATSDINVSSCGVRTGLGLQKCLLKSDFNSHKETKNEAARSVSSERAVTTLLRWKQGLWITWG